MTAQKNLSPTSRAAARASLLCAEEAATSHDTQARSDDFRALKRAKELQRQVAAIRLKQAQAVEAQRLIDLELAQATAACESASDDADRIVKADAVRRAAHLDEVRLRREVVARLPAVSSDLVASGKNGGAAGAAPRRGAAADGGGLVAEGTEVHSRRVDPPLPPGPRFVCPVPGVVLSVYGAFISTAERVGGFRRATASNHFASAPQPRRLANPTPRYC